MPLIAIGAVGIAGVVALRAHDTLRSSHPTAVPADAASALRIGTDLARQGRDVESAPYLAHAAADSGATWFTHVAYATTLYNITRGTRRARGMTRPWARRSIDEVGLLRRCFEELNRAERLAPTPAARAVVWYTRSNILALWGIPWDALFASRTAFSLDPQPKYGRSGDAILRRIQLLDQDDGVADASSTRIPMP